MRFPSFRIDLTSPKRRHALAFGLGILATGAFAPFSFWWLLIPSLSGLWFLAAHADRPRQALWHGWWWAFGHYMTSWYWIAISMLVDARQFAWAIPFAVCVLPAFLAFYPALVCALTRWVNRRDLVGVLCFATFYTFAEWLRGVVFYGFPWNVLGYAVAGWRPLLQLAWPFGEWGTTWLLIAFSTLPALALNRARRTERLIPLAACLAGFIAAAGWGSWRIASTPLDILPDVTVRMVQASIPQSLKWDPRLARDHVRAYYHLTIDRPGFERVTHVIWPESAVPFTLTPNAEWPKVLKGAIPPQGALLTGVIRESAVDGHRALWNSLAVITADGMVGDTYDKARLVPFGEFVPLRGILPIEKLTPGMLDFSWGTPGKTIFVPHIGKVAPLICYEAIYPFPVPAEAAKDLHAIVNVTNDGWFGNSSGPYQHLAMAQFRAVESGLAVLRAANNGVTAAIDPLGSIYERLPLNAIGVVDAKVRMLKR